MRRVGAGRGRDRGVWRLLVPVTALGAGLMFATSASTAQGTDLRAGRFSELKDLIGSTSASVTEPGEAGGRAARRGRGGQPHRGVVLVHRGGGEGARRSGLPARPASRRSPGPGMTVSLDDAPRPPDGQPPASDNPDDLVVHQQDVQSVVNALWAGGAEAMTLMGERLVSTSAVRCVGNTLLIQGRLVGPPFVISRDRTDPGHARGAEQRARRRAVPPLRRRLRPDATTSRRARRCTCRPTTARSSCRTSPGRPRERGRPGPLAAQRDRAADDHRRRRPAAVRASTS